MARSSASGKSLPTFHSDFLTAEPTDDLLNFSARTRMGWFLHTGRTEQQRNDEPRVAPRPGPHSFFARCRVVATATAGDWVARRAIYGHKDPRPARSQPDRLPQSRVGLGPAGGRAPR